jgi:tetratricopeptide (TPR) repeat protein
MACEAGWLDAELYFERDFQELKTTFDASDEDTAFFRDWFLKNKGLHEPWHESVEELQAVLERLPEHAPAHMDVAGALYQAGQYDEAEYHLGRALELGYPLPGLVLNYRACIAARRGDFETMKSLLTEASRRDPQHWALLRNVQAVREWIARKGPEGGLPLDLVAKHEFQLLERTAQPTLPGPLPDDFATWTAPPKPPAKPIGGVRPVDPRKLTVLAT